MWPLRSPSLQLLVLGEYQAVFGLETYHSDIAMVFKIYAKTIVYRNRWVARNRFNHPSHISSTSTSRRLSSSHNSRICQMHHQEQYGICNVWYSQPFATADDHWKSQAFPTSFSAGWAGPAQVPGQFCCQLRTREADIMNYYPALLKSAWHARALACSVLVLIVTKLPVTGVTKTSLALKQLDESSCCHWHAKDLSNGIGLRPGSK